MNILDTATVSELSAWYADNIVKSVTSHSTYRTYKTRLNKHIIPTIGAFKVKDLKKADVQNLVSELSRKPVSPATIRLVKNSLHKVLEFAVDMEIVDRNVSNGVKLPKAERYQPRIYSQDEIQCLLDAANDTILYIPILLAAKTGLRRSEILSLCWRDVNIPKRRITVCKTARKRNNPKTQRSIRTLYPSAGVMWVLKKHKSRQWKNPVKRNGVENGWGYVISKPDGKSYNPSYISRRFNELLKANNLPPIRFHDLRHAYATHAHFSGMPIKELVRSLGHNSAATTLDNYVHITERHKT
jgi:integrase